jgi:hypothetical protein
MLAFLVLAVSAVWPVAALENGLGLTPAMGWMQRDGAGGTALGPGTAPMAVGMARAPLGEAVVEFSFPPQVDNRLATSDWTCAE